MNELLLYGEVVDWWEGICARDVAQNLIDMEGDVSIRVMSGGGDVFEGLSIYNSIAAHKGKTIVHVDGLAASIASYFIMAADEIVIHENSQIMIHNPWTFACGESADLRKQAEIMDKLRDTLVDGYHKKSGLPRDEIVAMMDEETWLTADEAVEKGFADRVEHGGDFEDITNSVGAKIFNNFTKTPVAILAKYQGDVKMTVAKKNAIKREGGVASRKPRAEEVTTETEDETITTAEGVEEEVDGLAEEVEEALEGAEEADAIEILEAVEAVGESVELAKELIREKISMPEARKRILSAVAGRYKNGVGQVKRNTNARVGTESPQKRVQAMASAIVARASGKRESGGNAYSHMSLFDMARASLIDGGGRLEGLSRSDIVSRALRPQNSSGITHTTSDFPLVLDTAFRTSVMREFEAIPQAFTEWTSEGSLPDFLTHRGVGIGDFSDLVEMGEAEEYTFGTLGEHGEDIQIATYGRMIGLSRKMIINDTMDLFGRVPRLMAFAATRTIAKSVSNILIKNGNLRDGQPLFSAAHSNILTGAGSDLTYENVKRGEQLMMLQKSPDGNIMGLRAKYLIVPVALSGIAELITSENLVFGPNGVVATSNTIRGLEVIVDPNLDADSQIKWYLAADENYVGTVEVSYLDGEKSPFVDSKEGWEVDGIEFKVRQDAGVAALDYRGLVRGAGTPPTP